MSSPADDLELERELGRIRRDWRLSAFVGDRVIYREQPGMILGARSGALLIDLGGRTAQIHPSERIRFLEA